MERQRVERVLNGLVEELAAAEHERWSSWQRYVHERGQRQRDGSLLLSAELVERWERQIATPYADLNDDDKERDREQVRRYLPLIKSALTDRDPPD